MLNIDRIQECARAIRENAEQLELLCRTRVCDKCGSEAQAEDFKKMSDGRLDYVQYYCNVCKSRVRLYPC